MKFLTAPNINSFFFEHLHGKISFLAHAAEAGKEFLVLRCKDPLESALWIIATFYSDITVVPIPESSPDESKLLSCLDHEKIIFTEEYLDKTLLHAPPMKSLQKIWAIIFSSGSSGTPKAVALSGSALKGAARAHQEHLNFSGTWLLNLPLFHIGGFSIISRAFFLDSDIALSSKKFDVSETWRWLQSGCINGISLVPTTLFRMMECPQKPHEALRVILLGGAPTETSLIEQALDFGLPIHQTYGLTEACSQVATEAKPRAGLMPLPGVELRERNGELLVKSPYLSCGFYNKKIEPLPLKEGFLETNDLVTMKPELKILGRKSDLMISGGLNIFPTEIESAMAGFNALRDFAVFPKVDKEWGDRICAVYSGHNETSPTIVEMRQHLKKTLDPRKIPKEWIRGEVPRSAAGKILRGELKKIYQA